MNVPALAAPTHRVLRQAVFASIRDAILDGRFRPGERLSEGAVAEQLGVSRSPIREALRELEKEGLVTSWPNRGVAIAAPTPDELREIYAIRGALERLAVREAVAAATPEDVAALRRIVEQMRATRDADRSALVHLDVSFHGKVREIARNRRLEAMLGGLDAQIRLAMAYSAATEAGGLNVDTLIAEHAELFAAIEAGDGPGAEALMARHIKNARERLLARLRADVGQAREGDGS